MFLLGERVGKYQVERHLGSGTYGVIYLVRDMYLDRQLAIKVPHDQSDAGRAALLRESRVLAALEHPNIVRLITCDEHDGSLFLVMEWVDGPTLAHRVERNGPLPAARALRIGREIASGLAHAHRRNVLHGDLSADNILVSDGRIKIADFGIARTVQVAEHASGRAGNPWYMAPEQLRGEAGLRSDLYSLGVVLFLMLTGDLPYRDADPTRQLALVENGGASPRRRNPAVSRDVDEVVGKALAPRRSDRYENADALLSDLEELAAFGTDAEERQVIRERIRVGQPRRAEPCWHCGALRHPDALRCARCGAALK